MHTLSVNDSWNIVFAEKDTPLASLGLCHVPYLFRGNMQFFRKEVTSTVLWLRDYGVDITCVKVKPYIEGDKVYLDTERILPIQDVGDYQIRLTAKKQEEVISSKEEAARFNLRYRF